MRFSRYPRARIDARPSKARLATARRALKRQRDQVPLFADQVAADQPTAEGRIQSLDEAYEHYLQRFRDFVAASWRRARKMLREMPAEQRAAILAEWQYGHLPGSSEYLLDLIRRRMRGEAIHPVVAGLIDTPKTKG